MTPSTSGAVMPLSFNPGAHRAPASLPSFAACLVKRFYDERFHGTWNGASIMAGRTPGPQDLVMQSNDYLAIAGHPDIAQAIAAASLPGRGSPVMSAVFLQEIDPQHRLEGTLAAFLGYPEGILAQSGYAANVGLLQSVIAPDVPVYIDVLAHASLQQGVRAAGASPIQVPHNDTDALRALVAERGPGVILIDSVYSTNGSLCDLKSYADIASATGCMLIVDESHSLGTHGARGEGLVASLGLQAQVHFITASLAKAYACRAGFIACPSSLSMYLRMTSLPAIFSSSLMPLDVAAIATAHRLIASDDWRRERLWHITRHLRAELGALGYPVDIGTEQIVAFEIGAERTVMQARDLLESHGIFGSIFCAPATSKKRALIRFSLNAGLSDGQIEHFLEVCKRLRERLAPETWSARSQRHREVA